MVWFSLTLMVRFWRNEDRSLHMPVGSPILFNLYLKPLCQTESKAFSTSSRGEPFRRAYGADYLLGQPENYLTGFLLGKVCSLPFVEEVGVREMTSDSLIYYALK